MRAGWIEPKIPVTGASRTFVKYGTLFFLTGALPIAIGLIPILFHKGIDLLGILMAGTAITFPFFHIFAYWGSEKCAAIAAPLHISVAALLFRAILESTASLPIERTVMLSLWCCFHVLMATILGRFAVRALKRALGTRKLC